MNTITINTDNYMSDADFFAYLGDVLTPGPGLHTSTPQTCLKPSCSYKAKTGMAGFCGVHNPDRKRRASKQPKKPKKKASPKRKRAEMVSTDVQSADAVGDCVICLEPVVAGLNALNLSCVHIYHRSCARKWSKTKGVKRGFHCAQCQTVRSETTI
jgi:hypothetical protein